MMASRTSIRAAISGAVSYLEDLPIGSNVGIVAFWKDTQVKSPFYFIPKRRKAHM
jgi:hypothetical protein